MNTADALLDQKFEESFRQLASERKRSGAARILELIGFALAIGAFLVFMHFVFWGAGLSKFGSGQHQAAVTLLKSRPGPHQELVAQDLAQQGYISLVDYHRYVGLAKSHAQSSLAHTK